jgi:AcrR family transcriptional regulator
MENLYEYVTKYAIIVIEERFLMPKAFSNKEKEIIQQRLLEEGKKLLERYGIQKTTVEDITRAAGISKGAFYLFYQTKEELFFEIFESVEQDFRRHIFKDVFQDGLPPRDSFKNFLETIFLRLEQTLLLQNAINQNDFSYLMRKLPEEKFAAHLSRDNHFSEEFYQIWRDKGFFRNDLDPSGFAGVMKLLFYLVLHRREYSPESYRTTKELFIKMLCEYLIADERSGF